MKKIYNMLSTIKSKNQLWIFSLTYTHVLISCSILTVMAFSKIFMYFAHTLGNKYTLAQLVLGFIAATTMLLFSFTYSHVKFLYGFSYNNFKIHRSGKLKDDIWFITAFLLAGGVFNAIILIFISSDLIYGALSMYCVQTNLMYYLLKTNRFNHKVVQVTN